MHSLAAGQVPPRARRYQLAVAVLALAVAMLSGAITATAAPVESGEFPNRSSSEVPHLSSERALPHVGAPPPLPKLPHDNVSPAPSVIHREAADGRSTVHYRPVSIDEIAALGPEPPPSALGPLRIVTRGELGKGESLSAALRAQGIGAGVVHVVARELRPVFDFRRCQPGDRYRLEQDPDGRIVEFRYSSGPEESYVLTRRGAEFEAEREVIELTARPARVAGVVQTSLYEAIRGLGEDPQLAGDFAELFAWDIDFSRTVQPGDDFKILYERLYRTDLDGREQYVRPGRILAGRYRGSSGDYTAVYFEGSGDSEAGPNAVADPPAEGRYYRADGSSIEREFLVAPLRYSRISSSYSAARRHPILKVTRPHHGIDYAAPAGAPVWAVAEGTVSFRGWAGGFGNLVKVRHADGYISYYAHLQKFEKGLRVGQAVTQKQVLGYVGKTGLATGPHVCFRVAKDGQYVNPLALERPAGKPVPDEHWVAFQVVRDSLLDELDGHAMIVSDEAL